MPGHVLVCPFEPHKRLTDLSPAELTDLMLATQRVQRMLARHYFPTSQPATSVAPSSQDPQPAATAPEAGSFNLAIQDGPEAGQTVAHVHVHVIPRIRGSTAKNTPGPTDELYVRMAEEVGNVGGGLWDDATARYGPRPVAGGGFPRIEDCDRAARDLEDMIQEVEVYKKVLEEIEG
jgi:bis(5'-adenosyl)-triphosphatase